MWSVTDQRLRTAQLDRPLPTAADNRSFLAATFLRSRDSFSWLPNGGRGGGCFRGFHKWGGFGIFTSPSGLVGMPAKGCPSCFFRWDRLLPFNKATPFRAVHVVVILLFRLTFSVCLILTFGPGIVVVVT